MFNKHAHWFDENGCYSIEISFVKFKNNPKTFS